MRWCEIGGGPDVFALAVPENAFEGRERSEVFCDGIGGGGVGCGEVREQGVTNRCGVSVERFWQSAFELAGGVCGCPRAMCQALGEVLRQSLECHLGRGLQRTVSAFLGLALPALGATQFR